MNHFGGLGQNPEVEIDRRPRKPILMGHSMGGALTQWVLKERDDLPTAVLVAPWQSHSMMIPILRTVVRDPAGFGLCTLNLTTAPLVRNPFRAAQMFTHEGATLSPQEPYERLGPESLWVLLQYNPPLWRPAVRLKTPLLWLTGAADTLIAEKAEAKSARHYGADYVVVSEAGHNVMMEKSWRETAQVVHEWLTERVG